MNNNVWYKDQKAGIKNIENPEILSLSSGTVQPPFIKMSFSPEQAKLSETGHHYFKLNTPLANFMCVKSNALSTIILYDGHRASRIAYNMAGHTTQEYPAFRQLNYQN